MAVQISGNGEIDGPINLPVGTKVQDQDVATESFVQTYAPPTDSPTLTGNVTLPSTTSIGTISSTELGYVDGVTSSLQTQLNAKAPSESPTFTGSPTFNSYVKGFGNGVSTYEGNVTLTTGQTALIIQNNNGYTRAFVEIFAMSQHGSNGFLYMISQLSRYGRTDISINESMAYTNVNFYQNPSNVNQNAIQFARTDSYASVTYRITVRAIAVAGHSWSSPAGLTLVSRGF